MPGIFLGLKFLGLGLQYEAPSDPPVKYLDPSLRRGGGEGLGCFPGGVVGEVWVDRVVSRVYFMSSLNIYTGT